MDIKSGIRYLYSTCTDTLRHAESCDPHSNTKQMAREGQKLVLMTAVCCITVCLCVRASLYFLLTTLLSVKSNGLFACLFIYQFLLDFKGILLEHLPQGILETDCQ